MREKLKREIAPLLSRTKNEEKNKGTGPGSNDP